MEPDDHGCQSQLDKDLHRQPPKDNQHIPGYDFKMLKERFPHPNMRANPTGSGILPVGSGEVWNRMTDWGQLTVAEQTSVKAFLSERFSVDELELAYDEYYKRFGRLPKVNDYRQFILNWEGKQQTTGSLGDMMRHLRDERNFLLKHHALCYVFIVRRCIIGESTFIDRGYQIKKTERRHTSFKKFEKTNNWVEQPELTVRNTMRNFKFKSRMEANAILREINEIQIILREINEIQMKIEPSPAIFFQKKEKRITKENTLAQTNTMKSARTENFLESHEHKKWVSEEKDKKRLLKSEFEFTENFPQNLENKSRPSEVQENIENKKRTTEVQDQKEGAQSPEMSPYDKSKIPVENDTEKSVQIESDSGDNLKEKEQMNRSRMVARPIVIVPSQQDEREEQDYREKLTFCNCQTVKSSRVNPVFISPFGFRSIAFVILVIIVSISCEVVQTVNGTTVNQEKICFQHSNPITYISIIGNIVFEEIDEFDLELMDTWNIRTDLEIFYSGLRFYHLEDIDPIEFVNDSKEPNTETKMPAPDALHRQLKETNTETGTKMSAWFYPVMKNVVEGPLINLEDLKALSYGRQNGMKGIKSKRKGTTGYLDVGTAMYAYVAICIFLASVFTTVAEIALVEMPMMFLRKELVALFCMAVSLGCLHGLIQHLKEKNECKTTLEQKETFCFRTTGYLDVGTAMYAYVAICIFLASVFTTVAEMALVEMPMMFLRKELVALFCMAVSLGCLHGLIQHLKEKNGSEITLGPIETFCIRCVLVGSSLGAILIKAIQLEYNDPPVKVLADTFFLMYFVLTTLWTLYFIFCSIYNYLPHAKELSLQWATCAAKVIYGKCMQAQLIMKKCFRTALDVKEIISRKIMCLRAMLIGIMIFVGKAAHLFSMTWEIIRMINKTGMKEALECLNSQHTEENHEKKEKDLSDEPVVEAVHKNHIHDADKTKDHKEINTDYVLGEPIHAVEVNEMSFNKDVDLEPQIDHVDSENENQNTDGSHKPNKGTKVLEDEAVENVLSYSTNKMEAVKEVHAFDATALIDIRADVNIKTSEVNSNRSCQNKATENEMTSCIDGNEAEYNPKNGDVESINMIQIQRSGTDTFSDNVPHVFISFDTEPVRSLIPQEGEKYPTSQYLDQIVNGNKSLAETGEIVGKNEEFKCRSENLLNPDAPAVSIISMKRQSSVGLIDENETSVKFTENHHSVNDISLDKHDFDDDDDEVFLDDHAFNMPSGGIQQCTEPSEYNSFVFTRTCEVKNSTESPKGDVNVEKHNDKVWQIPDYTLVPGHMEVVSDESFLKSTSSYDSEESLKKTSRDLSSSFAPSFCSLKNDQEYVVGQVHSITSGNIGDDSRKHALSCNENENNNNVSIEHTKICKESKHTYNVGTEQTLYCNPDNKLLSINPTSERDSLSSSTVIDLQKKQERKIEETWGEKINEKKGDKKELEAAMIESKKVYVKETVERNVGNSNSNKTNAKNSAGTFTATRRRKVKRISRRRLRQIITPTHEWFMRVSNDTLSRCTRPGFDKNTNVNTITGQERRTNNNDRNTVVNNRNSQLPVTNRTNNQVNNNQNLTQTETAQEPRTNDNDLSFNGYFNKVVRGYNFEQQERMQFEMLRIQSFQDLPASCPASPLRMAKTGFYSSGRGDEVICFSCGVHHKNWQQKDIPTLIHKQISPGCKMVLGTETRNIPIERETNGLHRQPEPMSNGFAPSTIQQDGGSITQPNTRLMMENNVVSQQDISRSNVADELPQSLPQPSPMTPFSSKPPVTDCAEQLGIVLERPKYPAYAQLNIRVSTFQGWPGYLDQSPRDMALAGFFYAGYNDYCRCFYCGGGLRNWDAGDDPWVEHARWFPRCAFIIQNRGKRFVEIIEKRQAEMESSGQAGQTIDRKTMASADTTENAPQPSTQNFAATQTLTSFANQDDGTERAVQAVVEMGYSEAVVRRAVDAFKRENPGKTVDAASVFEIVLTLPDESNATNFTVTSETSEPQNNVARSNRQASTQAAGSKKDKKKSHGSQKQAAKPSSNSSESSLPSLSVNSLEHGNATGDQAQAASFREISESEIRSLQEENLQLKEQVMCKICMDKNVSIAFLPCGHLACCIDCAPAMRKCPMCRVFIKGTVKTYLA